MSRGARSLSWPGIVRMGLVQTALGSIVVLTTATLNRVMVVEMQLPAMLPGMLVALHYFVQLLRPRLGHCSDVDQRRTPWIILGMTVLAAGGLLAAVATAWMSSNLFLGISLAVIAYILIGIGVGAAGTSLLVLVAKSVAPERRAPAASIIWMMMIAGFVVTSALTGSFLDPFTTTRLIVVSSVAVVLAWSLAVLALWGAEVDSPAQDSTAQVTPRTKQLFTHALRLVWSEDRARRFTVFIFVSMLAYSAQDLILEPFAGLLFGFTVGESTQLSALQNSAVLLGMLIVAVAGRWIRSVSISLRSWSAGGCMLSALSLLLIALSAWSASPSFLRAAVFALGLGNGIFAVAAIGSMMEQASIGHRDHEGVRVGLWGAAQGIAYGLGVFAGAAAVDVFRTLFDSALFAWGAVFVSEAVLFLIAARLASAIGSESRRSVEFIRTPATECSPGVNNP